MRGRFIAIMLLLAGIAAFGVVPAYAGSIAVTSNLDDGTGCTLREAITQANAGSSGAGCTVVGTAPYTITLPTNTYTVAAQLPAITTAFIIDKTSGSVIIQANASPNIANYLIFFVTSTGSLTLDGITVQNGGNLTTYTTAGGCISVSGQLTLQNESIVQNCRTRFVGGAIRGTNGSSITITDSTIQDNIVLASGGSIHSDGSITVTDSSLINNRVDVVSSAGNGFGGAILASGTLSITGSVFSGNSVTDPGDSAAGGALYSSGTTTISDTVFTGNSVSAVTNGHGGAIRAINGTLSISDSIFTGNSTLGTGGGGAVSNSGAAVTITTSRFETNSTSGDGGAILARTTGNITISQSCLTNNGDTAVFDFGDGSAATTGTIDAAGGGSPNWWGSSWGPRISALAANTASPHSTGDGINGNGATAANNTLVNVGLTSPGNGGTAPTGAWLTSAPTIAGELCDTEATPATGAGFIVNVTYQGRPTAPHAHLIMPLTVKLVPTAGGAAVIDTTLSTDQNAILMPDFVTAGSYRLWIKGSHTLGHSQTITLAGGTNTVTLNAALREGDASNNNSVALNDFSLLAAAFGTATGDPAFNAQAEFNGDGFVSLPDFSLLATNFGATGPAAP